MVSQCFYRLKGMKDHDLKNDINYGTFIHQLKNKEFRETKRDGNCLYSSISLLIYPFLKNESFWKAFTSFQDIFEQQGIEDFIYECYLDDIAEIVKLKTIDNLEDGDLNSFIAYLRLLCSSYTLSNKKKYQSYLEVDIESYCKNNIDPMNQRADSFEILVLSDCLNIKINVISLFNSTFNNYKIGQGLEISLLHTPDHFQPLYD